MSRRNGQNAMPANVEAMRVSKLPALPTFNGRGLYTPIQFLQAYDSYCIQARWDDETRLHMLHGAMIEDAGDWFMLKKDAWHTCNHFRVDFEQTYWSDETQRKVRHRIGSAHWEVWESMFTHFTFYYRMGSSLTRNMEETTL